MPCAHLAMEFAPKPFRFVNIADTKLLNLFILFTFSSSQATCLADEPKPTKEYRYPDKLPGELYDADTQCKWQFGEKAKLCRLDFKKARMCC